jgi:hypothetical protein
VRIHDRRECVVVLGAKVGREADRGAIQHILDTFAVECGLVTSRPLAFGVRIIGCLRFGRCYVESLGHIET